MSKTVEWPPKLSIRQFALFLGCGVETARRIVVIDRKVPHTKVGRKLYQIDLADATAYRDSCRVEAADQP